METIETRFKSIGTVSKKFTIPLLLWEDWEKDCKDNFNNTYHLKMQFDHEFRQTFNDVARLLMSDVAQLQEAVFELTAKIEQLENTPKVAEPKEKRKTFGAL